ncbi:hypothetical protein Tco_0909449 [Tanacetum coccineum]|uniref:Uncharacterized protein n=1 Tax=Tanacetum coccineum TaxID=301880 RepID=A0ABQ5CWB9_9ASTR
MSVMYPNYVNLTSLSEEQPNERTPSPPPRKKSLSPPQAPSKSISSKSTHYTSSSSPSESPTPTHVLPPPKLCFVILIKLEPQELPPVQVSPNDPYVQTMDNWPPGPSNPSPPPRFPDHLPVFQIHHPDLKHYHQPNLYKYLEGKSMQRPPLFESDYFIYWKNRFETYVKAKDLDLWHIILNGDFPPLSKNEVTQILEVVSFEEQSDHLKKKLAKIMKLKCQVKDNKIDLLVQQYEQFTILEEESIDSGFARFNTIITSLKALDEGFSSKNYVRKFLRALHPKWRAKVMTIRRD